jgi:hypothetical protein
MKLTYSTKKKKKSLKDHTITLHLLQKGVSENFDFHVTLRHHQSYKLAAEYIFLMTTH